MAGYTRQSSADIVDGEVIEAQPLNDEFDALQTAFGAVTGHAHDGTTGNAPKINLTTSVSGILPVANGGTGVSSGTFVTLDGTQTLTNKSLSDSTTYIIDNSDATKKLQFQVSGITTATTRTLTAPDFDGTIATLAGTETFTNKTLTSPSIAGGALSGTFSGNHTYSGAITSSVGNSTSNLNFMIFQPTDYGVGNPGLFVKKTTTATKWDFQLYDGTNNAGTINFVSSTGLTWNDVQIVTTTGTQTLTNKTLTNPTINAATLTGNIAGTPTFVSGSLNLGSLSASNVGLEIGQQLGGSSTSTFIDFHSGSTVVDFDARILSSGGTGVIGGAALQITAASLALNTVAIPTISSTDTLTNKTLTSPTINAGALSGTFSGDHTYSGLQTVTRGTATTAGDYLQFRPSDYGVGKPYLFFNKNSTAANWTIGLWDSATNTGTIDIGSGTFTHSGVPIVTTTGTQTLTNKTLTSPTINSGALSGTFSGAHIYSGLPTVSIGTAATTDYYAAWQPTDYAAGKTRLYVYKNSSTGWQIGLEDGSTNAGTLNLQAATGLTWNGVQIVTTTGTQTLTNKTYNLRWEEVTVDANKTLTVGSNGQQIWWSAALAAGRTVTLSTTGAVAGDFFKISRVAGGAFGLNINGIKDLSNNQWCEVVYNGTTWKMTQYGIGLV